MANLSRKSSTDKTWVLHTDAIGKTLYTAGKYLDGNIEVPKAAQLTAANLKQSSTSRIGTPYDSTKTYAVGQIVTYKTDGTTPEYFYKCIKATTAGVAPGNTTYWEQTTDVTDTVDVVVKVPDGFYQGQSNVTISVTDVLPNLGVDAGHPDIKAGSMAYDDGGRAIIGTMPVTESEGTIVKASSGSSNSISTLSVTSPSITLGSAATSAPSDTPYITVKADATIKAEYNVAQGYHNGGKATGSLTQSTGTKYYSIPFAQMVGTTEGTNSVHTSHSYANVKGTGSISLPENKITIGNYDATNKTYRISASGAGNITAKVATSGLVCANDTITIADVSASGTKTLAESQIDSVDSIPTSVLDENKKTATKKYIKVSKEYYPEDRYITVQDATGITLNLTDKTGAITAGAKDANGNYPITISNLQGNLSIGTSGHAGWFTGGAFTDASAKVGVIAPTTLSGSWDASSGLTITGTEGYIKDEFVTFSPSTIANGSVTAATYSSSKAYAVGDVVLNSNNYYVCIKATTAGTAPTNTTYWKLATTGSAKTMKVTTGYYPEDRYITIKDSSAPTVTVSSGALSVGAKSGTNYPVTIGVSGNVNIATAGWRPSGNTAYSGKSVTGNIAATTLSGAIDGTNYVISGTEGYIKNETTSIPIWQGDHS